MGEVFLIQPGLYFPLHLAHMSVLTEENKGSLKGDSNTLFPKMFVGNTGKVFFFLNNCVVDMFTLSVRIRFINENLF